MAEIDKLNREIERLAEEVALKYTYMMFISPTQRAPADLSLLRTALIQSSWSSWRTDYAVTVKKQANAALKVYSSMSTWTKIPKGIELFSYGLPPAVARLYNKLRERKRLRSG